MDDIKILVDVDTDHGHFRDAIVLTEDDFNKMENPFQEIKALAEERVSNWVEAVTNPSTEEVTEE